MGYLLLSSVLCLIALSVTFTLSAACVALLRATALRGRERLLCSVWRIVLIFSLIPLNVSLLFPARGLVTAIVAERISQLTETYYALTGVQSGQGSDPYRGLDSAAQDGGSIVLVMNQSRDARQLIDPTPYICSTLLFVWFTIAAVKFILPLRDYAAGKKTSGAVFGAAGTGTRKGFV